MYTYCFKGSHPQSTAFAAGRLQQPYKNFPTFRMLFNQGSGANTVV